MNLTILRAPTLALATAFLLFLPIAPAAAASHEPCNPNPPSEEVAALLDAIQAAVDATLANTEVLTRDLIGAARSAIQAALEEDPDFVGAFNSLGDAWWFILVWGTAEVHVVEGAAIVVIDQTQ